MSHVKKDGSSRRFKNPEEFFKHIVSEMTSSMLRYSIATECTGVDVEAVRTKFRCVAESFLAFSQEVRNVLYCGNISSLRSLTTKMAAFCGSNSLSRSYGRNVSTAVKGARQRSKYFNSVSDALYPVCRSQIQNAADRLTESGESMVDNASSCGRSIVACADSAEESLVTSLMHISVAFLSGLSAAGNFGEGVEVARIKRVFEDVLKVLIKLREISEALVEKMNSLQQLALDLMKRSVDGNYICNTMDTMYVGLREIRRMLDSVLPQLLNCVESQSSSHPQSLLSICQS